MKRYIKCSISEELTSEGLKQKLQYLRKDLKLLARCQTLEDALSTDWHTFRYGNFLSRKVDKGVDFDTALDEEIESIMELIQRTKRDYNERIVYEKNAEDDMNLLLRGLKERNYNIIEIREDFIVIQPDLESTHSDCIKFVDDVVDILNGRYHGTGRGGSWTQWDIVSSNNVRFKAGWSTSFDPAEEDTWIVKLT